VSGSGGDGPEIELAELLDALQASAAEQRVSEDAESSHRAEREADLYERDRERDENTIAYEKAKWQLKHDKAMGRLRLWYSIGIFLIVTLWICIVAWCVLAVGYEEVAFTLSDTVLITLIGGMTANVIGMIIIILKFFFPGGENGMK
jgi:hypothetical protein